MKLSERIEYARGQHKAAYPNSDWKSVNETLSNLFFEALPILMCAGIDPWSGGNQGRADALRKLGY